MQATGSYCFVHLLEVAEAVYISAAEQRILNRLLRLKLATPSGVTYNFEWNATGRTCPIRELSAHHVVLSSPYVAIGRVLRSAAGMNWAGVASVTHLLDVIRLSNDFRLSGARGS